LGSRFHTVHVVRGRPLKFESEGKTNKLLLQPEQLLQLKVTEQKSRSRTKEEDRTPPNSPENSSPDSTPAKLKKSTYTYRDASACAAARAEETRPSSRSQPTTALVTARTTVSTYMFGMRRKDCYRFNLCR